MASPKNPPWLELVQLIPVVSLALPFILAGKIDFARAGSALLIAALLTLPISALVIWRHGVLNPILLGTGLWLWLSAIAFTLPLDSLVALLSEAQAAGLFAGVALVGLGSTLWSPQGFIGADPVDPVWIRRASWLLLGLSLLALAWSAAFRHNIRLGGGLPFIVLNVVRRVLILRAQRRA